MEENDPVKAIRQKTFALRILAVLVLIAALGATGVGATLVNMLRTMMVAP